jgi:uncharacterized membrane protein YhaH (DUF805 family)
MAGFVEVFFLPAARRWWSTKSRIDGRIRRSTFLLTFPDMILIISLIFFITALTTFSITIALRWSFTIFYIFIGVTVVVTIIRRLKKSGT